MQNLHGPTPGQNQNPEASPEAAAPDETRMLNPGTENPAPAAPQAEQPARLFPEEERPSFVGTLLRFVLMFGLMIGMFYGVTRYLKSKAVPGGAGDLAKTLATVPLAPGKHLQVVDLAGKILVLGVSGAGVQLVSEITDARTADRIRVWHDSKPVLTPETWIQKALVALRRTDMRFWKVKRPDFREELGQALGRPAFSPAPEGPAEADLFSGAEDELRAMLRDQKNRLAKSKDLKRKPDEA